MPDITLRCDVCKRELLIRQVDGLSWYIMPCVECADEFVMKENYCCCQRNNLGEVEVSHPGCFYHGFDKQ